MAARGEVVYPVTWKSGRFASWLVTVDHKRIGILYIATSLLFFGAGGILAVLMRAQLAAPNQRFLAAMARLTRARSRGRPRATGGSRRGDRRRRRTLPASHAGAVG